MRRAERFWRLGVSIALIISTALAIYGCEEREEEEFQQRGRLVLVTPDTATVFHREPTLNPAGTIALFSTDWPFDPLVDEDKEARDIAIINIPESVNGYEITGAPDTIAAANFRKVIFGQLNSDSASGGIVQFDANFKGKSQPDWHPTRTDEFALVIQNANFLDRIYICTLDLNQDEEAPITSHRFLPIPDNRPEWYFNYPSYSPDGRFLLFSRYYFLRGQTDLDPDIIEPQAIWVYDLTTDQEYQLTSGGSREGEADWSPNGRRIVFSSNRMATTGASRDLYTIDFDPADPGAALDLNLRRLTFSNNDGVGPSYVPEESFDPAWSPNGNEIVFVSTRRNTGVSLRDRSLWIMAADGSGQQSLVFTRFDDVNPCYANSTRLVYASGNHPLEVWRGQRSDVWLLRDF